MAKILVVDDQEKIRNLVSDLLRKEGYEVSNADSGEKCIEYLEKEIPDLIFLDLVMTGIDGLETLKRIKETYRDLPVVMLTSSDNIEDIVDAIKSGADDYITKGKISERLIITAKNLVKTQELANEVTRLKTERKNILGTDLLIGTSRPMKEVLALIEKASNCDIKVLINGETGTGKELVSRTIHNNSIRRDNPFVPIDCSMLPETLAESELFGYEKGSFTGAAERKIGRFEMANTGTLFLDEIANLSSTIQIKLLRFLEDKNISRLGSKKNVELDVRIISASNINLSLGVKDKKFREDLYYRLNVFSIDLPPLRDRGEDVIQLANYFLKKFSNEQHKNITGISNESITALKNYNWPGNVRELRNIMERAVLLANNVILPENLGINKSGAEKEEFSELFSNDADDLTLHEISKKASGIAEKRLILKILEKAEYNKTKAAEILKVDYKTLYNKMKEYNIS